jgi:hypothetical protein
VTPTRAAALAALLSLGLAPPALAQAPLRARALIPYTQRPEAITTLVVEANTERAPCAPTSSPTSPTRGPTAKGSCAAPCSSPRRRCRSSRCRCRSGPSTASG